jgi:hypothetical protein
MLNLDIMSKKCNVVRIGIYVWELYTELQADCKNMDGSSYRNMV